MITNPSSTINHNQVRATDRSKQKSEKTITVESLLEEIRQVDPENPMYASYAKIFKFLLDGGPEPEGQNIKDLQGVITILKEKRYENRSGEGS